MNTAPAPMPPAYDSGDTAWLLASTAMVLLMTPGLAFFYGGMVRTRHVLMMIKMSFAALAFGTLLWWVIGYTLAFGPDAGGAGLIGNLDHVFMNDVGLTSLTGHIPTYIYSTFQMGFAIITVALISGSIADRATMRGWLVFVVLWLLIVYVPLAHWVFDQDGWIVKHLGALDFAGGLPVELNSGVAGLAVALVLRAPRDFARREERPNNIPLVVIGAGLLWFGWFGFNSGSALSDQGTAAAAFINTRSWAPRAPWSPGRWSRSGAPAGSPPWASSRRPWRAWWPSRPPVVRSTPWVPSSPGSSWARSVPSRSRSSTASAWTTPWTSSACTGSADSSD